MPYNYSLLTFCFVFSISSCLFGQDIGPTELLPTLALPSDLSTIAYSNAPKQLETGFGRRKVPATLGVIDQTESEGFNIGLFSHPLFDIQGRVSGVSISRRGSNPFTEPKIHIRGISALGRDRDSQPLIVVDGVPDVPFSMIAPEDVEETTILKDAAAAAVYGDSGNSGVVLIRTKGGDLFSPGQDTSFQVNVGVKVGTETVADDLPVADRETYLMLRPNFDFGANTNWKKEVVRRSLSQVYQVGVTKKGRNYSVNAAAFNRELQGVGKKTDGRDLFGRINGTVSFLDNRLRLSAGFYGQGLSGRSDLRESFRYARSFSPTAPIFDETGDYFELTEFDAFNPVSIQEQSLLEIRRNNFMGSLKLAYRYSDFLTAHFSFSQHINNQAEGVYFPKSLFFPNFGTRSSGKYYENEIRNRQFATWLDFDFKSLDFSLGGQFRRRREAGRFARGSDADFELDITTFEDFPGFNSPSSAENPFDLAYDTYAVWTSLNYRLNPWLNLNGSARYEGSSRLPSEKPAHLYSASTADLNLGKLTNIAGLSGLVFRTSFGQTGGFPAESDLFSPVRVRVPFNTLQGENIPEELRKMYENTELKPERKTELNLGLIYRNTADFARFIKVLSVNIYNNTVRDLILEGRAIDPVSPEISFDVFANYSDIYLQNRGVELDLTLGKESNRFLWSTDFNLSFMQTITQRQETDSEFFRLFTEDFGAEGNDVFENNSGLPGGPGGGFFPVVQLIAGENFGQMVGLEVLAVNEDGSLTYLDRDGNGSINRFDRLAWGQAIPTTLLGLRQNFTFFTDAGKTNAVLLDFALRGEYGHSLFQSSRRLYETTNSPGPSNNIVQTEYWTPGFSALQQPNNRIIENASYTAVDFISFAYRKKFTAQKFFRSLTFRFTLQNPIWFTNYSAGDPTPSYFEQARSSDGSYEDLPSERNGGWLDYGIDRFNYYPRAKGMVFGINAGF